MACAGSVAFPAGSSGVVDESWAALRGIRLDSSHRHRSHYQDLAQARSSKPAATRLVSHQDAIIWYDKGRREKGASMPTNLDQIFALCLCNERLELGGGKGVDETRFGNNKQ